MRSGLAILAVVGLCGVAAGSVVVNQVPVSGGGLARASQLWQDPSGQGNDLDGDSVCWADFTLSAQTTITHLEWWGTGACELGFQIEFWKQDPGTIAYQPWAVFYYGGGQTVTPEKMFQTTAYTTTPGPGGINHHVLDMPNMVTLPANTAANPRWFVGIVGLTAVPYASWNWAQGTGGTGHTFQFIRGYGGGGPWFTSYGEGRALEMEGISATPPCYANCDGSTTAPILNVNDFSCFLNLYAAGNALANCDASTAAPVLNVNDFSCFLNKFAVGCP